MLPNKPVIRVTQLECFRKFLANSPYDYYEISEQSVIDTIRGKFKGNELKRIGTAFHSIVETGEPRSADAKEGCVIDVDDHGVRFNKEQLQVALDYRNEHLGAFHEVRQYKDYGRAIVTGCADLVSGIELRDAKTKFSQPTDRDYIDSAQWRYYLDIFKADIFHFDLFVFEGYKRNKHGYDVRELTLTRQTPPITCYRYPDMEADNVTLVNLFMDWAEKRNIIPFLLKQITLTT